MVNLGTEEETLTERLNRLAAEAKKRAKTKPVKTVSAEDNKKRKKDMKHEQELSLHSYCNSVLEQY